MLAAYRSAALPLETIWMSTGTMDEGMPFTVNNGAFMNAEGELRSILQWEIDEIQGKGQRLIARVHPAFPINEDFNLFLALRDAEALLKSTVHPTTNGGFLTADTAIASQANFPDFMKSSTQQIWLAGLQSLAA